MPAPGTRWNEAIVLPVEVLRPSAAVPRQRGDRFFCALMGRSGGGGGGGNKKDAIVFVTRDPVHTVVLHNMRAVGATTREKHAAGDGSVGGAPNWRLVNAAAFALPESAFVFGHELVNGTRGFDSKQRRFFELARRFNVPCYSTSNSTLQEMRSALAKHAPPTYGAAFDTMAATLRLRT